MTMRTEIVKLEIEKACNGVVIVTTDSTGKMTKYVMVDAEHAIGSIADMIGIDINVAHAVWKAGE